MVTAMRIFIYAQFLNVLLASDSGNSGKICAYSSNTRINQKPKVIDSRSSSIDSKYLRISPLHRPRLFFFTNPLHQAIMESNFDAVQQILNENYIELEEILTETK